MSHSARSLCLALAASLLPVVAAAQADPTVMANTRRDLARQALQARTAGDHAAALDLATRAGQIGMSTSLRRFIAEEQNALGAVGPALGSAELCVRDAERDTSPGHNDHLHACRALVTNLTPRVGRLVVEAAPIEGLAVRVADVDLPAASFGLPYVVTPGTVLVTATAPGFRPFRSEVTVAPGASQSIRVSLDAGAGGDDAPSGPAVRAAAPADVARQLHVRGPVNPWPVALAVVGAAGLVTGGVFYVLRGSAISARDEMCDATGCPPSALPDQDRAVTFTTATNVTLALGAACVVGGVIWYLVAPRRSLAAATAHAGPLLAPSAGGAVVGWQGTL